MSDTLTGVSPFIENVAREIASEAHCIGLSQCSYDNSARERKEAWQMIAIAAISAMRDEVGPGTVDRLLAPRRQG